MKKTALFIITFILMHTTFANCDDASQAFQAGKKFFASQEYTESAAAFREAYKARPSWKILFNIAQAEAAAKHYGIALETFEAYLAAAGDEIDQERFDEVMKDVQRLHLLVGVLDVEAPDGAELFVDNIHRGTKPFTGPKRIAVGEHSIKLVVDGKTILEQTVTIAGKMTSTVKMTATTVESAQENPVIISEESSESRSTAGETFKQTLNSKKTEEESQKIVPEHSLDVEPSNANMTSTMPDYANNVSFKYAVGGTVTGVLGAVALGTAIGFSAKFAKDKEQWENKTSDFETSGLRDDYLDAAAAHEDAANDRVVLITGYVAASALGTMTVALLFLHKSRTRKETIGVLPAAGGVTITF